MKRIILAAAAVVALSTSAFAADQFAGAYGNTVTQTLPDGTKITVYVNADGTWQQTMGGKTAKGTYVWKDATHACFTQTDPAPTNPKMNGNCTEITGEHKVGDSWTVPTPDGKSVSMTITAGRS
jgi:hypothetical protein